MNNFLIALQAIIPTFTMLFIGLIVRKSRILNDQELPHVNKMVFNVFFPLLMFNNIYSSNISESLDAGLMTFGAVAVFSVFVVSWLFVITIEKNNKSRGAMIQALYRSNFVLMGMPIASNLYGEGCMGITAVMISVIVPIYNVLAVITLETFRGGNVHFTKVLMGILKNPLIIGAVAGVGAVVLDIHLPQVVDKTVAEVAAGATPLALIVLGASFRLASLDHCRRNLIICVVGRLVVIPGVCLAIAAWMGFRDVQFVALIGLFCSPCAIASYTMAQQMDSDADLAANCVVFTSALACFSMFFWVFLFKQMGMF